MIESPSTLAEHAYVCLADDHLIFSDIRHDRYQCLDRHNTQVALRLFPDLPSSDIAQCPSTDQEQMRHIALALTKVGLLADAESDGKASIPVQIPTPTESFVSNRTTAKPRPGHYVSFLKATISASAKYRFKSLQRIIGEVERRKKKQASFVPRAPHQLLELVTIFHRLRPYYVREYLCRFDSLALIEFLAHYRQFPKWVFGVTGEPFTAHCWVQDENCVLNDTVDFVRRFTPIMAF